MAQLYRLSHYFLLQLYEQLRWCFFPKGLGEMMRAVNCHPSPPNQQAPIYPSSTSPYASYLFSSLGERRFGVRVRMTAVIITIRCDQ